MLPAASALPLPRPLSAAGRRLCRQLGQCWCFGQLQHRGHHRRFDGSLVPPTTAGSSATPTWKASAGSTASSLAARPVSLEPVTVPTKVLRSSKSGVLMLAPIIGQRQDLSLHRRHRRHGQRDRCDGGEVAGSARQGAGARQQRPGVQEQCATVSVAKWSVGGEALPAETMVATDVGLTGRSSTVLWSVGCWEQTCIRCSAPSR
jgi:hypothetical protein